MTAISVARDLFARPDLPDLFQQIKAHLEDEARRRTEFRQWLDESKKAEFINGEIVLHSPVKRRHLRSSENLSTLLGVYTRLKKLGIVMIEKALIGLTRNDYEPGIVFFFRERAEAFDDEQMVFPAPDFVVEILSKSTAKIDRGIKLADYAAHGVREYWIVDPVRQTLEQYLRSGNDTFFLPASKLLVGHTVTSKAVPGFEIPVEALFDDATCAEALQVLLGGG
ncbi:MAG: Uma2 family endonuclease [Saprospiraceae bacterium]